jgi:hypothetical protein
MECSQLPFSGQPGVCDSCGIPLTGRQKRWCAGNCEDNYWGEHYWATARNRAKYRDGHRCVQCGSTASLEVNHIEPRVGRGYNAGCHNHLSNLETLCHECHVVVTKRQSAERRALR